MRRSTLDYLVELECSIIIDYSINSHGLEFVKGDQPPKSHEFFWYASSSGIHAEKGERQSGLSLD